MTCPTCGKVRSRLFHRCSAADIVSKTIARVERQGKIGAAIADVASAMGSSDDWSPTKYAEYYIRSSTVFAAIRKRAQAVIRPPLLVYQGDPNGDKKAVGTNHPFQQLLDRANPHWSRTDLWRGTSTYKDIWGSAFWALAGPTLSGPPTEMFLIRSDFTRVLSSPTDYITGYEYRPLGLPKTTFRADEVIWFRDINPLQEFAGLSRVAVARLPVDMALEATRYNRSVFKNGPMIDNVAFMAKETMTEGEITDTVNRLKERYSGSDKARTPLVLGDMEAKNLGLSAKDMEWIASLRWSLEEVARVFSVPKILLEDLERSTYENFSSAERVFWREIASELQGYEGTINEMLAPQFGEGLFVEFDLSKIEALQPNINDMYSRLTGAVAGGLLTPNEAREDIGLDPVPEGDVLLVPAGLVPLGLLTSSQEDEPADPVPNPDLPPGKTWRKYQAHPERLLEQVGRAHVGRVTKHEGRFARIQRNLFEDQEKSVLSRLQTRKSVDITWVRALESLFDPVEWSQKFEVVGRPSMQASLEDEANSQITAFELQVSFDAKAEPVKDWLDQRVRFWSTRVNNETARLLVQEVAAAVENGESIKDMQDRIHRVFMIADAVRSERIARTEINSAMNRGSLAAYEQSDVVDSKMWVSTGDDRTRDTHWKAHRQTVILGSSFIVGGEALNYPGDTGGSAENIINCRCTMIPVMSNNRSFRRRVPKEIVPITQ